MAINVLGINHKTAPIEIREKLVFDKESLPHALTDIKNIDGVNGVILLSTCNRTEVYTENDYDNSKIIEWLKNQNMTRDISDFTYNYYEEKAIKHLLNVTSGIDSMVVGENEILGQVKHAFKIADSNNMINTPLKKLFEFSFSVAKQVRTDTDIGANPVTFMFTAMTIIKKIFEDFNSKRATIVGAGHMSKLAIKYLQSHGINDIRLTNYNYDKGQKVAKEHGCIYSKIQYIGNLIATSDIIITSTSSSTPVIGKGLMESCLKTSKNLPVVIIDLGVPRDVETEISSLDNVFLYSIDDLGEVISKNFKLREEAVMEAKKIIDNKIDEFKQWLIQSDSEKLVKAYRGFVDDITHGAIIKTKKMIESGENIDQAIDYLASTLKNKLTHETTTKLREILPLLDESSLKKAEEIFKKNK